MLPSCTCTEILSPGRVDFHRRSGERHRKRGMLDNSREIERYIKKVSRFWSARVGLHHRAVAVEAPDGLVWFWIGIHAAYDRLVG